MNLRTRIQQWRHFLILFGVALCFLGANPVSAQLGTAAESGGIIVYVKTSSGATLLDAVEVVLYNDTGSQTGVFPHRRGESFEFSGVGVGGYRVQAMAPGYNPASEDVIVYQPGQVPTVVLYLRPTSGGGEPSGPVEPSVATPKAQKETQKALAELRSNHVEAARKHLEIAIHAAPGSSQVNYLLGMTYVWSNNPAEAKSYLEKSVALDPKYLPSLLALGNVRLRQGDAPGAIEVLEKAVGVSASSWQAHWLLAEAYLRMKNYENTREHAERTVELAKDKAPGAQVLLGQALAALGKREEAATVFGAYLQQNPRDKNGETIGRWIVTLRQPLPSPTHPLSAALATNSETALGAAPAAPANPALLLSDRESWLPPDVDAVMVDVVPGAACSLPAILAAAGKRAEQLFIELQNFTAQEQYQTVEIRADGVLKDPIAAEFDYLLYIRTLRPGLYQMLESRQKGGVETLLPDKLQDQGAPAVFLIFHPRYQENYDISCDGQSQWKGRAAWVLHFQQRLDRPSTIRSFQMEGKQFPIHLRGRAWISGENYQLLHMETDLVAPLAPIQLQREHMSIDFHPVPFPRFKTELWLPQDIDIFFDFKGRILHHYHHFSNFKLFAVGVEQKIGEPPKSDQPQ